MDIEKRYNIYRSPDIVLTDADVGEMVRGLKEPDFRTAVVTELVASRKYLEVHSEATELGMAADGQVSPPVSLWYYAALCAEHMRLVYSHKTFLISTRMVMHPMLKENNIMLEERADINRLYGFIHHHGFLEAMNIDHRGEEFAITPNTVLVDTRITQILGKYGYGSLLNDYHASFQRGIHDHLHLATLFAAGNPYRFPTPRHKHAQAEVFHKGVPEKIGGWRDRFHREYLPDRIQPLRTGYETWANQAHQFAYDRLFTQNERARQLAMVEAYIKQLASLKQDMLLAGEKLDLCNDVAGYMVCVYLSQMFATKDPREMYVLDTAIRELDLPPEQPNVTDIIKNLKPFSATRTTESILGYTADVIKLLKMDSRHKLAFYLHYEYLKVKDIPDDAYVSTNELLAFIDEIREKGDESVPHMFALFSLGCMFLKEVFNDKELQGKYEAQEFWLKLLKDYREEKDLMVKHDTHSAFRILKDLGILDAPDAKSLPQLSGLDAIRYRCFLSQNGMFEGLHDGMKLLRRGGEEDKSIGTKREFEITAEYAGIMNELGREISWPLRVRVLQDLSIAAKLTPSELGIVDYYDMATSESKGLSFNR